ncbi:C40 family peptidase [Heliophilum fasciatum]|uniref:LysM domain-containing protein n=1 Tax=Heliophilum fasciatum TaxID=35700 RepID=A0A4R2REK2_9FIRM|nr:C40 family peptidase [Heliophilum fasciatum]MCW2279296.1 cell wall-associated NlpC family hydrolase [Heliophilum fasciatum]TCP60457.1 LysM domain-containing protein [Heliophilum fasciatum]
MINRNFMAAAVAAIMWLLSMPNIALAYAIPYQVQEGDTLWGIAQGWRVTVEQIMKQNNFTFDIAYPGQVIQIPITAYKVGTGDTFYIISRKTGIPVDKLTAANPYIRPENLQLGQWLSLPVMAPATMPWGRKASEVIALAQKYLGTPYQWGARPWDTSRFDCSSFTQYVFGANYIQLRRVAAEQAQQGFFVGRDQLRKGDLMFFWNSDTRYNQDYSRVGHVGIYMGERKFIHAAGVRLGVVISSIDDPHYVQTYIMARRIIQ